MKSEHHTRGVVYVIISTLMFGSYGVWSRLLGERGFGIFYQGWVRALLMIFVLLPILIKRKEVVVIARKDWKWLATFLIFTSATQVPLYYAFNHMDIGTTSLLFFVTMLITMYLVGVLFLNERITTIKGVAFLLACLGLYVIFSFSLAQFTLLAALAAVLNGVASGGEVSFSKKLSGKYSPIYLVVLSQFIIAITHFPLSRMFQEVQYAPGLSMSWLYMVGYALAGVLGFGLLIAGLKHLEASVGGLLGLLEIVFSVIFGILLFSELLTTRIALGGLIIILAAALPHLFEFRFVKQWTRTLS